MPQTTTGTSQTPAELLIGHKPKSRLDVLHPDVASESGTETEETEGET